MKLIKYSIFFLLGVLCTIIYKEDLQSLFLKNKAYSKHLAVRGKIVSKEQLERYFCNAEKPTQLSLKQLFGNQVFIFIEIKNQENLAAWGELECASPEMYFSNITVDVSLSKNKDENFNNIYVIDLGNVFINPSEKIPTLQLTWKKLYTK